MSLACEAAKRHNLKRAPNSIGNEHSFEKLCSLPLLFGALFKLCRLAVSHAKLAKAAGIIVQSIARFVCGLNNMVWECNP